MGALLLVMVASAATEPAAPLQCSFGGSSSLATAGSGSVSFTCTPPHPVGKGKISLDVADNTAPYIDAQVFSYASDPSPEVVSSSTSQRRSSLVEVAALALGADGGCATGACNGNDPSPEYCPPGYPGPPKTKANGTQRILDYLTEVRGGMT